MTDQSEINRRNQESVFQQLKDMDIRVRALQVHHDNMLALVASINDRLLAVEQALLGHRIKAMGTGPTEKRDEPSS